MQWPFTKRVQGGLGIWRRKKTRRGGFSHGHPLFTWPLGQPCWPQARLPQQELPMPLPLGLRHLQPLPALVLCLQVLSRRLGQQVPLFCSWRCQYPLPNR